VERGGLRVLQEERDVADTQAEVMEKGACELATHIVQDVAE
jgi:hypothetical protein